MSYLPQENALVIGVLDADVVADWDREEEDSSAWSGSVGGYVVDNLRTVYSDNEGGMKRIRDTTIYVPVDWITQSGVKQGQSVVFMIGSTQHIRQIMDINAPSGGAVLASTGELAALINVPATLHLNPDPIEL